MSMVVVLAVLLVAGLAAAWMMIRQVHICPPNEVLLLAGGKRRVADGWRGYRAVKGARAVRVPLIERVFRLDLTVLTLDVQIVGYARDAVVMRLDVVVRVRAASSEPLLGRAAECLVGKSRSQIADLTRMIVRGEATTLLCDFTPNEVAEERDRWAEMLVEELAGPLAKLGLELEGLELRDVSDESGYFDALRAQARG